VAIRARLPGGVDFAGRERQLDVHEFHRHTVVVLLASAIDIRGGVVAAQAEDVHCGR